MADLGARVPEYSLKYTSGPRLVSWVTLKAYAYKSCKPSGLGRESERKREIEKERVKWEGGGTGEGEYKMKGQKKYST